MAGKAKLAADDLGDPLQRPQRSGKARGLGASHQDLRQGLLLGWHQPWFAPGATSRAQGVFTAFESLLVPAQDRLAADLGAPGDLRLGKTFLQERQRAKPALLHCFEITSCCHARKGSSHPALCHYITQCSIEGLEPGRKCRKARIHRSSTESYEPTSYF